MEMTVNWKKNEYIFSNKDTISDKISQAKHRLPFSPLSWCNCAAGCTLQSRCSAKVCKLTAAGWQDRGMRSHTNPAFVSFSLSWTCSLSGPCEKCHVVARETKLEAISLCQTSLLWLQKHSAKSVEKERQRRRRRRSRKKQKKVFLLKTAPLPFISAPMARCLHQMGFRESRISIKCIVC